MTSPNLPRVLIVGTGSIGERHLRCFLTTGRVRVAACEPNPELRSTIQERYQCPGFASLEEALQDDPWEAAVICTPAPSHLSVARRLLEAGAHVLIEKPLATDLQEAEDFLNESKRFERVIRVAYIHRSIRAYALAKELLTRNNFGPVRHVTATCGQNFPSFRPAYRSIYYARHESGGGAIQDALTHTINTIEWLAGPTESLYCDAAHQVLEGVEVEDTVNLVSRQVGGAMASYAINQFQAPNEATLSIHAAGGSLKVENSLDRVGEMAAGASEWSWHQLPAPDRDTAFVAQAHAFLDACDGKKDHLTTLAEGLQTLKVNLAALQSAANGQRVYL